MKYNEVPFILEFVDNEIMSSIFPEFIEDVADEWSIFSLSSLF
jgi:hypothetical protein